MPIKTTNAPSKKYSGFVQCVGITCILVFLFLWSIVPYQLAKDVNLMEQPNIVQNIYVFIDEIIEILPQRYWIVCIECMILMNMLFIYIGLPIFNDSILNVPLDDLRTIADSKSSIVEFNTHQEFMTKYAHQETSGVYDIPITKVCKILHGGKSKIKYI